MKPIPLQTPSLAIWLALLTFAFAFFTPQHLQLSHRLEYKIGVHITQDLSRGRYGASAVIFEGVLLLIGGQIPSPSGLFITNDVVALNLSLPYSKDSKLKTDAKWSQHLLPNAWAAASETDQGVWLIGGVTQDCETDAIAMVLNGPNQSWTKVAATSQTPPRRRQAQAITLQDGSLYLWGGIAEPYTCSLDTVGYMGLDVWNTLTQRVKTYSWEALSSKLPKLYKPPISDYAAVLLPDQTCIAFIGGQISQGHLADMQTILVLDTSKMEFTLQVSFCA
jgi:hypothetical protein